MYEYFEPMRKYLAFGLLMLTLASCGSYDNGELVGVEAKAWNEPKPYGMVLIKQNSFDLGADQPDSLFGLNTPSKPVSVSSFWMDETEITNGQYKQFIQWVCDSIYREKLADPAFGGNEEYKIFEDENGEPVKPYLNWRIPIPARKHATEEELTALNYFLEADPVLGGFRTKTDRILYQYEWFDHESAAKRAHQLDARKRNRNTDLAANPEPPVMISKDTAYITESGQVVNTTLTRELSSRFDFLHTRIVAIYPDTTCWVNDFQNSYNNPYLQNYFSHEAYNAHPVVGVSWEQAVAFCHWRTQYLNAALSIRGQKVLEYRLPTEAEWEMAARGGDKDARFPWKGLQTSDKKGCYFANYKPEKGGYTRDGNEYTAQVASYPANTYGLFDMAGNVAEWTSTSWSPSGYEEMEEINPSIHQTIPNNAAYINKRKVVRGGSWKDAARFIEVSARSNEYQNESRSYIGFRCVRSQIGN